MIACKVSIRQLFVQKIGCKDTKLVAYIQYILCDVCIFRLCPEDKTTTQHTTRNHTTDDFLKKYSNTGNISAKFYFYSQNI